VALKIFKIFMRLKDFHALEPQEFLILDGAQEPKVLGMLRN